MAMKAGMIYSKITSLTTSLETYLDALNYVVDKELLEKRVQEISDCCDEETAETFKRSVEKESNKIKEDLSDIINKLTIEANAQKDAYYKELI